MTTWIVGERRSGTGAITKQGSSLQLAETYVYLIETDDPDTTRVDVLVTSGLPIVGLTITPYGAVCTKKSAVRSGDNTHFWEVSCDFETDKLDQEGSGDPDTWYPIFELNFETYEEFVTRDKNGKRFLNSAGDVFDYDFAITRRLISIDFFQYETATLTEVQISNRNETINSISFVGYPAKTLLLTIKKASKGYINGAKYWRIEYKMTYKATGWNTKLVDEGPRFKDPTLPEVNGEQQLVPFVRGFPPTPYVGDLDLTGHKLVAPTPLKVIEFPRYDELSFINFIRRAP